MNRDQFIDYLENPEQLDHDSLISLDELVREYPFCQPAQILLLKNLQTQGNIRFNKHLKITAAYSFDRSILYTLLHEYRDPEQEVARIEEPEIQSVPTEVQVSTPVAKQKAKPESEQEPLIPFEEWNAPGEEWERDRRNIDYSSPGIIKTDYIRKIEQLIPIVDIDLLVFDFPAKTEADLLTFEYEKRAPEYKRPAQPEEPALPEERTTSRELIREFMDSDPLSRYEINLEPIVHIPVQLFEKSSVPPPSHQGDLIDQFIQGGQSRLIRPKEEKELSEDLSIRSLREDDNILTETLASIFVQQKYYLKAIHAFEKLSLKYPEKSIYFASQIEKIKELIKNQ